MGVHKQKCLRNYKNMVFKIKDICIEKRSDVRTGPGVHKLANTLLNEIRHCQESKYNTEQGYLPRVPQVELCRFF